MVETVEGLGEHTIDARKLRRRRFLSLEEFVYARARTDRTIKVTLPGSSLYANFWTPEVSKEAYPTLDDFLEDVAEIPREEGAELGTTRRDLHPARRAALPFVARPEDPRVLRGARVGLRPLDEPRDRAGQPRNSGSFSVSPSRSTCAGATRGAAGLSRAPTSRWRAGSSNVSTLRG